MHRHRLSGNGKRYTFGFCRVAERLGRFLGQRIKLYALDGQLHPLIQLGQANDILDERHQSGGFTADAADKDRHILRLHQTVLHQLRAAHDGLQRRFQLMGHIGGKFPAIPLGQRLLCHVERQDHRAGNGALGFDAAHIHLVLPALALRVDLAVALFHGGLQRMAHIAAPFDGQEVLSHTGAACAEQGTGRRVDAEDHALFVQQHQPFPHIAGDLVKFIPLALQFLHMRVDLTALLVDTAQQRRQFLIGIIVHRMLQIQLIERLHNVAGQPPGQQR